MKYLLFFLGFTSCSSLEKAELAGSGSPGGADFDPNSNQMRLDIHPQDQNIDLLSQSWIADGDADWGDLTIEVNPSVSVSGQVLGYTVQPLNAEVPGGDRNPVTANITVQRPGTISSSAVTTDTDGTFSLEVPPARGYTISISPDDTHLLPFQVVQGVDITDNLDLEEIDLGYGLPVYGRITNDEGTPIHNALVNLKHVESGIDGASVVTDSRGHYLIRALPDDYLLCVKGSPGVALPFLEVPATVNVDQALELDVNLGNTETVSVQGQLTNSEGTQTIRDVKVRLSSDLLDGTDGRLVIETETDRDGLFSRNILPGSWIGEFISAYDDIWGSLELTFRVSLGGPPEDLEAIPLPDNVTFSSTVLDPNGNPIEGAAVNAHEMGFDSYIYSTTTNSLGRFSLELPPHPVALAVAPPTADLAVTRKIVNPTEGMSEFILSTGDLVAGKVISEGTGLEFALVEVRDMTGQLYATTITGPEGDFAVRIEGL